MGSGNLTKFRGGGGIGGAVGQVRWITVLVSVPLSPSRSRNGYQWTVRLDL